MVRNILSTVAGVVVAFFVISAVESLSHQIYPVPAGLDFKDPAAMAAHIKTLPFGAFLFVVVAWMLGSFVGSLAATILSGGSTMAPGLVVGSFVLFSTIIMLYMIPHPLWMMVISVLAPLPLAYGAVILVRRDMEEE